MLSNLAHDDALWAIALLALVIGAADTIFAMLKAIRDKVFSREYVAEFLTGHAALRFAPIVLLAFIAATVSAVTASAENLPTSITVFAPGVWVAAWGGLLAYATETVASLQATKRGDVLGTSVELEGYVDDLPTGPMRFQVTTATMDEKLRWGPDWRTRTSVIPADSEIP